ncbi:hypothetical protein HORIV_60660 [Vreelandella olivaria]|uniref:Glutathionylspermidine synthase pre-ATP-grasp-like domain-containing protein n=1 Tax=Vreelandella olivaria TaxID=390919 RepID=A0ABN5X9P7_9GAMM|nr:hypothetical protein HORIV_60660 [Halomonas olivaria]
MESPGPRAGLSFSYHRRGALLEEDAYYQFTLEQVERDIEAPTETVHEMCMELVDKVCHSNALMQRLALPEHMWDSIHNSWKSGQPHLYGRMDFCLFRRWPGKTAGA